MFNTWSLLGALKVSNQRGMFSKKHAKTRDHGTTCSSLLLSWSTTAARIRTLHFVFSSWAWSGSAAVPNMSCATLTICRTWTVRSHNIKLILSTSDATSNSFSSSMQRIIIRVCCSSACYHLVVWRRSFPSKFGTDSWNLNRISAISRVLWRWNGDAAPCWKV